MTQEHTSTTRDFYSEVQGRRVPAAIWLPADCARPRPVVFVGHGGSGHKRSQLVLDLVQALVEPHQMAVVAIDGPVHGARRAVFEDGPLVRQEFRDLWTSGLSIDPMMTDWQSCIDYVCQLPEIDPQNIAWYGISMGTAYGIPLLGNDLRFKAAVLGMWGTCREPAQRLVEEATRIMIPILFQVKEQDDIFTPQGQQNLYQAIGSSHKEYKLYSGGHTDPKDQQLADIVKFLVKHLQPDA